MRRLAGAAVAVASLLAAAPASACSNEALQPTPETLPRVRAAVLCLVNGERAALGLATLRASARLDAASTAHSDEMVANHYLAHEREGSPSLLDRLRGARYFAGAAGGIYSENIGIGADGRASAGELVAGWMQSPEHRANIVYPRFRELGVGIAFAAPDPAFYADYPSAVFTTDFGRRYGRRACRRARTSAARRWCRPPR
jgi:uncharacterized protein YkwD